MADLAPLWMAVRLSPYSEGLRRNETGLANGLFDPIRKRLDQPVVVAGEQPGAVSDLDGIASRPQCRNQVPRRLWPGRRPESLVAGLVLVEGRVDLGVNGVAGLPARVAVIGQHCIERESRIG